MTEPLTDVTVKLTGEDGNAFYIIGAVKKALQRAGHHELANQYEHEATSGDYDHLLRITMRFVNVD